MYAWTERVRTAVGRTSHRANSKHDVGGRLQVADIDAYYHELRKRGKFVHFSRIVKADRNRRLGLGLKFDLWPFDLILGQPGRIGMQNHTFDSNCRFTGRGRTFCHWTKTVKTPNGNKTLIPAKEGNPPSVYFSPGPVDGKWRLPGDAPGPRRRRPYIGSVHFLGD